MRLHTRVHIQLYMVLTSSHTHTILFLRTLKFHNWGAVEKRFKRPHNVSRSFPSSWSLLIFASRSLIKVASGREGSAAPPKWHLEQWHVRGKIKMALCFSDEFGTHDRPRSLPLQCLRGGRPLPQASLQIRTLSIFHV